MSREELVEAYDSLVTGVVRELWGKCIGVMTVGDMRSCAFEGLLQAREKFDPDNEAEFATFAYLRIRGAVIDGLRRARWGPRTRPVTCRDDMTAAAIKKSGNPEGMGEQTAGNAEDAAGDYAQLLMLGPAEFERLDLADRESQYREVTDRQLKSLLAEAIRELGEVERAIVRLHDIEGRSFAEIADEVGCSKSWASRLRDRAIDQMRDYLEEAMRCEEPEAGDHPPTIADAA